MKNINKINRIWFFFKTKFIYGRKFIEIGKKSIIFLPLQIDNPSSMKLGNNVFIAHYAWLMGRDNGVDASLIIGDDTVIGHFFHLTALREVSIGKSVLIADKVFISDSTHEYEEINIPVKTQAIKSPKKISIGDGAWIGENVCICGASIGKNAVIGANSVVTKDIPDYSVAVGAPAQVIKFYDSVKQCWTKCRD